MKSNNLDHVSDPPILSPSIVVSAVPDNQSEGKIDKATPNADKTVEMEYQSDNDLDKDEESDDKNKHIAKAQKSKVELQQLIDEKWSTTARLITWTTVKYSVPNKPTTQDYRKIGIHSFDFDRFRMLRSALKKKQSISTDNKPEKGATRLYLDLFMRLWPGNWKDQITKINKAIVLHYATMLKSYKHVRIILPVTREDFWSFVTIIVAASVEGFGGERLWERASTCIKEGWQFYIKPTDIGATCLPKRQFKDIRKFFHCGFSDLSRSLENDRATYDPWWEVILVVKGFNENRKNTVCASFNKTLDKSMSSYRPQTSKFGGYPNITHIFTKPKPLGTELKTTCCAVTGIMLHAEIQRGKLGMQEKYPDNQTYGATAACTFRHATATQCLGQNRELPKRNLFYGDSWFASVKTAEGVQQSGHDFVGPVKTSTKNFPKDAIEKKPLIGRVAHHW